jgi:EmrB/QacA subfamily drug resistance transporter
MSPAAQPAPDAAVGSAANPVVSPAVPSAIETSPGRAERHRWLVLAVLCVSVFVTVLDGTIVNIALPTLNTELGATTRELQWIVDAYLLVFTGLLLAAGGLGDRYGRRRALLIGLVVFAATSALAGSADTPGGLIAARGLMGIGAALIFPATLAIITNVFTNPKERAAAIGVWSAVTGVAVAAGPIVGGWLLEHFWWGSVFYVNLPVAAVAVVGVLLVVPESRDESAPRLDVGGLVLSIAAIATLVFTIIEAPEWGWLDARILGGFALSAVLIAGFARYELRQDHPLLPVQIFRNLRFTAASVSVTSAFFALFGFIFLVTQYFQLIRGYGPLAAGVRTVPVATAIAVASVLAPKLAARFGTKRVVATGLLFMAIGFLWVSTASATTPYLEIVGQMFFLGAGLGMTTAPATESIMGSVTLDQAGIGSAVNDTTRELGGTLGVAVVGSVFSSVYVASLADSPTVSALPEEAQRATEDSVGAASVVAGQLGDAAPSYLGEVSQAFLDGFAAGCYVAGGLALAGCVFALRFLPSWADSTHDEIPEAATTP